MSILNSGIRVCLGLGFVLAVFMGCESTESGGGAQVSGVYYGVDIYDPWYYGTYYPPDVIVPPPSGSIERPPHVEHPIARPSPSPRPTPMPSIPMAPRPALRC